MDLFSEFREGIGISFRALWANKMRSALTTLGIVIGIVTVTLMGTAITGLNQAFLKSISAIGADVLYVQRFSWFNHSYEQWLRERHRQPFTLAQVESLEKQMKLARAIAPMADSWQPVQYKNRQSSGVTVIGTTEQFAFTSDVGIAAGRFLSSAEVKGGRPVCVVGSAVATNLFQLASPLGERIRVGGYQFEVIGVLESKGNFLGRFSLDNQVVVPMEQFLSCFGRFRDFQVQVKVVGLAQMAEAKAELAGLLRKIRHVSPEQEDDFAINQQEAFLSTFHRVAGTIASVGLFITGLSLFVGGIGIMNIMFVSVAERTHEIGLRKAIGAKRRTILLQFLIEAAAICLFGGLLALSIAWPLTFVISKFLPATLSLGVVGIALLVSLVTGVLSGFFPAWRAARMNPVDALRQE